MLSIDTIVVPQGAEYQAVCRGLARAKAKNVTVIPIPIGVRQRGQVLADHDLTIHDSRHILIMGLGGSLARSYAVGRAVVIASCENLHHDCISLNDSLTVAVADKLAVNTVTSLTSDRVITQVAEKLSLAQDYSASVIEMEGYYYAQALQQRTKQVAMVRVISDDCHGDIPHLNQAIDSQGNLQALPLAIALLRQPLGAVRLIRGSLTGLRTLERVTAQLFAPD
ncbi:MAG: phosphorylase [Cyanobacteria bacterium J06623_7]